MARIRIKDLPQGLEVREQDQRRIVGGAERNHPVTQATPRSGGRSKGTAYANMLAVVLRGQSEMGGAVSRNVSG